MWRNCVFVMSRNHGYIKGDFMKLIAYPVLPRTTITQPFQSKSLSLLCSSPLTVESRMPSTTVSSARPPTPLPRAVNGMSTLSPSPSQMSGLFPPTVSLAVPSSMPSSLMRMGSPTISYTSADLLWDPIGLSQAFQRAPTLTVVGGGPPPPVVPSLQPTSSCSQDVYNAALGLLALSTPFHPPQALSPVVTPFANILANPMVLTVPVLYVVLSPTQPLWALIPLSPLVSNFIVLCKYA